MQKILYFTAGPTPTGPEAAEIDALVALAAKPYDVHVRNGAQSAEFGAGRPEPADYVAGTIPTSHDDAEDFPVFDLEAPPRPPNLPATTAVVYDQQELTIEGDAHTFTVVDGEITAIEIV